MDEVVERREKLRAKLANLLGAVALGLGDQFDKLGDELTIGGGETAAALVTIGAYPGLGVGRLAKILKLTHPGAVRLLDRLEAAALAIRGPGRDKRTVTIQLTALGTAKRNQILDARAHMLAQLLGPLEGNEALSLARALDRILSQLAYQAETKDTLCRLCDKGACTLGGCPTTSASSVSVAA